AEQHLNALALTNHRIALADQSWRLNHVARAEEILEECPPALRRWEWHYLKRRCHRELLVRSLPGAPNRLMLSADGTRVAAIVFPAQPVEVYDGTAGRRLFRWVSDTKRFGAALSPDGRRLAIANVGAAREPITLRLVDVDSGKEIMALPNKLPGIL